MCFTKDMYKLKTLQAELPLTGAVTAMPNRRNRQHMKLKQIKLQFIQGWACMFIIHFMASSFAAGKKKKKNVNEIFEKINSHDIKTYSFIVDFWFQAVFHCFFSVSECFRLL